MATPTTEIGHGGLSQFSWADFADSIEEVPELFGMQRIVVFNRMRNDAMIAGLLLAMTMPIRRYRWYLDPNGASDEVVANVQAALSLPVLQEDPPRGRRRGRFSFDKHLQQALLSLPYGCVDEQTEALTRRGWVTGFDLREGDEVLTLNPETGLSEWHPVQIVSRYEGTHPMRHLEGRSHSSLTTLNHNWIVRSHHNKKLGFKMTAELNTNDGIVRAAPCVTLPQEAKYSDALVELVAWYFTEGTTYARYGQEEGEAKDGSISIWQSQNVNEEKCGRIRAALTNLFGPQRETSMLNNGRIPDGPGWKERAVDSKGCLEWHLNLAASQVLKDVAPDRIVSTEFLTSLTRAQLDLFLNTSLDADGHWNPDRQQVRFIQKDARKVDPIETVCALLGVTTCRSWAKPPTDDHPGIHQVTIGVQNFVRPVHAAHRADNNRSIDDAVDYTGTVWCPTVQNHTWLARRRGTVYYTGNSMFFEQRFGWLDSDADWKPRNPNNPGLFTIRKLAARMPLTISEIKTARDGGLLGIRQWPDKRNVLNPNSLQPLLIPTNRLVAYVHEQEGQDWYGTSVLRSTYKNWLVKDKLIRIDTVNQERNGVGIPIVIAGEDATREQIHDGRILAQAYRAGQAAGGALPFGWDLRFRGVEGSTPDTIASIRYHDEQITKSVLGQFLNLGTTDSGSRSLGETFVDFFKLTQEAIAREFMTTFNQHVIEDLVDHNFGIDAAAPLLAFDTEPDASAAIVDLVALVNAGLIEPDDGIKEYVRDRYKLPEASNLDPDDPLAAPKLIDTQLAHRERPVRLSLPKATKGIGEYGHLREKPVALAADDDAEYEAARDALLALWVEQVKPAQIDDLVAAIEAIDPEDVAALVALRTSVTGAIELTDAMTAFAATAATAAYGEAAAQGIEIDDIDTNALNDRLTVRGSAIDAVMAQSISTTAAQQALRHAGGSLTSTEIAAEVREHLESLTDTYPKDMISGALTQAENTARFEVFGNGPEPDRVEASELRDARRCAPCKSINGKVFKSLAEAEKSYPTGGYSGCLGGARCRGTILVSWKVPNDAD